MAKEVFMKKRKNKGMSGGPWVRETSSRSGEVARRGTASPAIREERSWKVMVVPKTRQRKKRGQRSARRFLFLHKTRDSQPKRKDILDRTSHSKF